MNKSNCELWLPEPFDSEFGDEDREIYEELAATSLSSFTNEMRELEKTDIPIGDGDSIGVFDLRAEDESNSQEAIVLLTPFADGYSPSRHILARVLQKYLPNSRVVVFPNNAIGREKFYTFDEMQATTPILSLGKKVVKACVELGIKTVKINGYSQGASVGAAVIKEAKDRLEVDSAILVDAPNVTKRKPSKLGSAFIKTGVDNLNKAINDSGIPALSEAQRARRNFIETLDKDVSLQYMNLIGKFALGSLRKSNKVLYADMAGRDFSIHLNDAKKEGLMPRNLLVARMAESLICREELDFDMRQKGLKDSLRVVDGYGHEGGYNVVLNAILSRIAFGDESLPQAANG